jgi:hypothetical protein
MPTIIGYILHMDGHAARRSTLCVAAMSLLTVVVYRLALPGWISHVELGVRAASFAWMLAGALVLPSAGQEQDAADDTA